MINENELGAENKDPSREEVLMFLKVFNRLGNFEAQQRHTRGWGAFSSEQTFPIPEVVSTISWLCLKYGISNDDMNP